MPVRPHPDAPDDSLLLGDDGVPLARMRVRDDDGTPVAADVRALSEAPLNRLVAQVRRDLAGHRLETPDEALAAALVADGLELSRAATDMRHDLTGVPEPVALPDGWSLGAPGWDDDLAEGLDAAYGPDHPDGRWQPSDTDEVRAMFDTGEPVPPLVPASARLIDPDGRSTGHVLCAGPVPWTDDDCVWILNLGVAPRAQRRGFGRALLVHALRGARAAGLPSVGLSVVDGNPARHMYDAAGFRTLKRVLTVRIPDA
ncbi:GNAT family N-acetyltransferase [Micromonospora sp. HUAS YX12]|uniref:GNAT family N-acetyltransferase n=1 Tax=Micromonospora sp. HUAS YX12 TaxID=3156396 RepID=A0AAU7R897_9ACTN